MQRERGQRGQPLGGVPVALGAVQVVGDRVEGRAVGVVGVGAADAAGPGACAGPPGLGEGDVVVDVDVGGVGPGAAVPAGDPLALGDGAVAAGGVGRGDLGLGDEHFLAGVLAVVVGVDPVGELGPVVAGVALRGDADLGQQAAGGGGGGLRGRGGHAHAKEHGGADDGGLGGPEQLLDEDTTGGSWFCAPVAARGAGWWWTRSAPAPQTGSVHPSGSCVPFGRVRGLARCAQRDPWSCGSALVLRADEVDVVGGGAGPGTTCRRWSVHAEGVPGHLGEGLVHGHDVDSRHPGQGVAQQLDEATHLHAGGDDVGPCRGVVGEHLYVEGAGLRAGLDPELLDEPAAQVEEGAPGRRPGGQRCTGRA